MTDSVRKIKNGAISDPVSQIFALSDDL